jgi:hypothetical protein
MAVKRSNNFISQQRVDVPHLRSIESAVSNDFDELVKSFLTNGPESYVVRGLEISMPGSIGSSASSLQLIVDNAAFLIGTSGTSGTFLSVPTGTPSENLNSSTNSKVSGAFTPNATNYLSIDFLREIDDSTLGPVQIWSQTTKNETSKTVPLAQILGYKLIVSTSPFDGVSLPIALIKTDASNNVVEIDDSRPLLYRLGTAGVSDPNPFYTFDWTLQSEGRQENPYSSSDSSVSPFRGGDKQINSLKTLIDAMMSSLKEIKGTVFWYSQNKAGSLFKLKQDTANTVLSGRGTLTHSLSTPGLLNWSDNIFINFVSSRVSYQLNANPSSTDISLADGQVAYVTLQRDLPISPKLVTINGSPTVTSVGSVPWTSGLVSGDYIKNAALDSTKYYRILTVDSPSQVTLSSVYVDGSSGAPGIDAQYSYGIYSTSPVPSTTRHIRIANRENVPFDEDTFWLYFRDDRSGSIPRIYVRFLGAELEQGESKSISDETPLPLKQFLGFDPENGTSVNYTAYPSADLSNSFTSTDSLAQAISTNTANLNDVVDGIRKVYYERMVISAEIDAGTAITIPLDTRNGSVQKQYLVGNGALFILLNGSAIDDGVEYSEMGVANTLSTQITINIDLEIGDVLTFRMFVPEIFASIVPAAPFWRLAQDSISGTAVSFLPNVYNLGTDKLSVWRNGVHIINSASIGSNVDRYLESGSSSISLGLSVVATDVIEAINYSDTPNWRTLISTFTGSILSVPSYVMGADRIAIYRNGILMNDQGLGSSTDQYTEASISTLNLVSASTIVDVFDITFFGSSPIFRNFVTGVTGTVINTGTPYTVGNSKLLVFKNGVLMTNSLSIGTAAQQYQESGPSQVTLQVAAIVTDVFCFINLA